MVYLVQFILVNTGETYRTLANEMQLKSLVLSNEILITEVELFDLYLEYDKVMELIGKKKSGDLDLEFGVN